MLRLILLLFGKCPLFGKRWRLKLANRQLKRNRSSDFHFYDFYCYFYYFSTVFKSKSLYFFLFFFYFCNVCFLKLNEIDTSLYFLTVEKVLVSLLTQCLSN